MKRGSKFKANPEIGLSCAYCNLYMYIHMYNVHVLQSSNLSKFLSCFKKFLVTLRLAAQSKSALTSALAQEATLRLWRENCAVHEKTLTQCHKIPAKC